MRSLLLKPQNQATDCSPHDAGSTLYSNLDEKEVFMWEYCTVVFCWKGRGLTQEIDTLYKNGEEMKQLAGELWSDFLDQMGQERWELITFNLLGLTNFLIAIFKRPI